MGIGHIQKKDRRLCAKSSRFYMSRIKGLGKVSYRDVCWCLLPCPNRILPH